MTWILRPASVNCHIWIVWPSFSENDSIKKYEKVHNDFFNLLRKLIKMREKSGGESLEKYEKEQKRVQNSQNFKRYNSEKCKKRFKRKSMKKYK